MGPRWCDTERGVSGCQHVHPGGQAMVLTATPAQAPAEAAQLDWRADGWCKTSFRAMGTTCQLMYRAPSRARGREFRDRAVAWVLEFERKYSRFRDDSMISEINRRAG